MPPRAARHCTRTGNFMSGGLLWQLLVRKPLSPTQPAQRSGNWDFELPELSCRKRSLRMAARRNATPCVCLGRWRGAAVNTHCLGLGTELIHRWVPSYCHKGTESLRCPRISCAPPRIHGQSKSGQNASLVISPGEGCPGSCVNTAASSHQAAAVQCPL